MPLEKAAELLDELTRCEEIGDEVNRAVKGEHPRFGKLYIVFPAMGDSIILPFAGGDGSFGGIETPSTSPFVLQS